MSDDKQADKLGNGLTSKGDRSNSPVKRARKKRYHWPPPVDQNNAYVPKQRNPIQSILTALPILMLVAGLYIYYDNESEQANGGPIFSESIEAEGVFTGLSVVKSGPQGRHYLWIEVGGSARGVRIKPEQVATLQVLKRGDLISLKMSPTVHASKTYWAWYVEQSGQVLLNTRDLLQ